jgi:hypothetical protein
MPAIRARVAASLYLAALAHPSHAATRLQAIYTYLPGIAADTTQATNSFANGPGGHMGILTFELDDEVTAIQIGLLNNTGTGWSIGPVAIAPSASYGPDTTIGAAAYDLDGAPLREYLPVQFPSGTVALKPPKDDQKLASLITASAAGAGTTVLDFASTQAAEAYAGISPGIGWNVADGLGCVAAGTTVAAVTATTITLSRPLAASCGAGQAIDFSKKAFAPFVGSVPPASADTLAEGHLFSQWITLHGLPRADTAYAPGASVTGPGIAPGTTLLGTATHALVLSSPTLGAVPTRARIDLTSTAATSAAVAAGSTTLPIADGAGVLAGQTVSGDPALSPGTHVLAAGGGAVTLDQPLLAPLADGTPLAFTATTWTAAGAPAGSTQLPVPSTSRRQLFQLRYFVAGSTPPTVHFPGCVPDPILDSIPCEAPLGLPAITVLQGDTQGGIAIDGVNYPARVGAGNGSPIVATQYPTFFFRFRGVHKGATLLDCGGFQMAGATGSVTGVANFARIAAAAAGTANPAVPISVINAASSTLSTAQNWANCRQWLSTLQPNLLIQQDYSNHDGETISDYMAQVQAISEQALAQGAASMIFLGYTEAAARIGELPVAGPVTNSTSVPLLAGFNFNVAGSNLQITGPGVPPGTTANTLNGHWSMTLSQPVTLPAGTVLQYGFQVASQSGASVVFTHPSFATKSKEAVTAEGAPPHEQIAIRKGSTAATLTDAAAIPAGTFMSIGDPVPKNGSTYAEAAAQYRAVQDQPWAAVQLDGEHILNTDPDAPDRLCHGCSTYGSYANDDGNMLIAGQLVTLLQQATGQ